MVFCVVRNGITVSEDPCYSCVCWSLIIAASWVWPLGDQGARTTVKTLNFSKYFVGSGANPMHAHVVWKSLVLTAGSQHNLLLLTRSSILPLVLPWTFPLWFLPSYSPGSNFSFLSALFISLSSWGTTYQGQCRFVALWCLHNLIWPTSHSYTSIHKGCEA